MSFWTFAEHPENRSLRDKCSWNCRAIVLESYKIGSERRRCMLEDINIRLVVVLYAMQARNRLLVVQTCGLGLDWLEVIRTNLPKCPEF